MPEPRRRGSTARGGRLYHTPLSYDPVIACDYVASVFSITVVIDEHILNHRYTISTVRLRLKEIFDPLRSVTYKSERQIFDPTTIDDRTVTAVVNRFIERIGSSEGCHVFANVSRSPFRVSHTHRIFPISRRFRIVGQTPSLRSSFPISHVAFPRACTTQRKMRCFRTNRREQRACPGSV